MKQWKTVLVALSLLAVGCGGDTTVTSEAPAPEVAIERPTATTETPPPTSSVEETEPVASEAESAETGPVECPEGTHVVLGECRSAPEEAPAGRGCHHRRHRCPRRVRSHRRRLGCRHIDLHPNQPRRDPRGRDPRCRNRQYQGQRRGFRTARRGRRGNPTAPSHPPTPTKIRPLPWLSPPVWLFGKGSHPKTNASWRAASGTTGNAWQSSMTTPKQQEHWSTGIPD